MDLTKCYKLTNNLQEIAAGDEHSLVTIQNNSTNIVEMTLDERSQEQREAQGDKVFYRIKANKERTFKLSSLAKINAKKMYPEKDAVITVIKS